MKQLAKLEQKLPAALKKAGVPQIAALVLLAVSVFGIGGAKLAGYYSSTMAGFNSGKYSITADLDQRVSAAANVVTVAKKIAGVDEALLTAAEDAVNALSEPLARRTPARPTKHWTRRWKRCTTRLCRWRMTPRRICSASSIPSS